MGTSTGSSTPSDPAGIGPSTSTARTPAAASSRTSSGVVGPVGRSVAVPATRLKPSSSKSRSRALPSVTATTCLRGSAVTGAETTPPGGAAPPSDVSPDVRTRSPARSRRCTVGLRRRESAAATPSAPAAPPGAATFPYPGPAAPSLPAGATTSVSSASAPAAARARGPSGKDAKGSTTPTSAILTASCASPSRVGIHGRLEAREHLVGAPVDGDAAVRVGLPPRDANRQQRRPRRDTADPGRAPYTRDEPGKLRPMPLGPARQRRVLLAPPRRSRGRRCRSPGSSLAWKNGWLRSTPVSSRATVTPVPSAPGSARSTRRPLPDAKTSLSRIALDSGTAAGYAALTG